MEAINSEQACMERTVNVENLGLALECIRNATCVELTNQRVCFVNVINDVTHIGTSVGHTSTDTLQGQLYYGSKFSMYFITWQSEYYQLKAVFRSYIFKKELSWIAKETQIYV